MAARNIHDASGQLLGYFYQVLSALLLLLETKEPEAQICVEKFDDVTFMDDDIPQIMVQTKHHIERQGTLNDTSNDLWRTINSWCDSVKTHAISNKDTDFIIITTAKVADNTAAFFLRKTSSRKPSVALNILRNTANSNTVKGNQLFYQSFLSLNAQEQENIINHCYICDCSPQIKDIKASIMPYIRTATLPKFEDRVYDRIIGWWTNKVIQCLVSEKLIFIGFRQLQNAIFDIGSEYKADSLPIDFNSQDQPSEEELMKLSSENRLFIEQLRLIELSNPLLKRCVREYYNAYRQRSKWLREELLYVDDLQKYEDALVDEWNRLFLIMQQDLEDYADCSDKQKCIAGRKLLGKIEELDLRIRPNVSQPFIMRGTYHKLADQKKVGWHVDFMERLCQLLKGETA